MKVCWTLPLACSVQGQDVNDIRWKAESKTKSKAKSVWPDLAKFRLFGNILQDFDKFLVVYFLFGKMVSLLW